MLLHLADELECDDFTDDTDDIVRCLKTKSLQELLEGQRSFVVSFMTVIKKMGFHVKKYSDQYLVLPHFQDNSH